MTAGRVRIPQQLVRGHLLRMTLQTRKVRVDSERGRSLVLVVTCDQINHVTTVFSLLCEDGARVHSNFCHLGEASFMQGMESRPVNIRADDRRLPCVVCASAFPDARRLSAHVRVYHKIHICPFCGRAFTHAALELQHRREVHELYSVNH
jgi:hypothetical protein